MTLPPDAQTPTPRTEEIIAQTLARHRENNVDDFLHYCELAGVLATFARQLERDLAHDASVLVELNRQLQAERERGRRVREETIEECARVCQKEWQGANALYKSQVARELMRAIRAISRAESAPEGGKDD